MARFGFSDAGAAIVAMAQRVALLEVLALCRSEVEQLLVLGTAPQQGKARGPPSPFSAGLHVNPARPTSWTPSFTALAERCGSSPPPPFARRHPC